MKPTLQINNASLSHGDELVFSHINLKILPRKWIALLGPHHVGKSALLRMIAGKLNANEVVHGVIHTDNQLAHHQQVTHLSQENRLHATKTVRENLIASSPTATIHEELIHRAGIAHVTEAYPSTLSASILIRIQLLQAAFEDKPIVLIDDLFATVDTLTRHRLQTLAAELLKNKTVLLATREPNDALRLANDIYIMQGKPANLQLLTTLHSARPRECEDPSLAALQTMMAHRLDNFTI